MTASGISITDSRPPCDRRDPEWTRKSRLINAERREEESEAKADRALLLTFLDECHEIECLTSDLATCRGINPGTQHPVATNHSEFQIAVEGELESVVGVQLEFVVASFERLSKSCASFVTADPRWYFIGGHCHSFAIPV
jgi:hypothetical protein